MVCCTWLVGCSGLVIDVGLPNVGLARSTRCASGETGRHASPTSPDSSTTLMHSADMAGFPSAHAAISVQAHRVASPRPMAFMAGASRRRRRAGVGAGRISLGADNEEVVVELDVDLTAGGLGHLDLVVVFLVTDLGAGDGSAAGERQSGLAGLRQRLSDDRCALAVVGLCRCDSSP